MKDQHHRASDKEPTQDSTEQAQKDWSDVVRRNRIFWESVGYQFRRTRSYEVLIAVITGAGVILAGIVAAIYWGQWNTMQLQLEATERPWVYASIAPSAEMFTGHERMGITVKISLKNTGHSPATAVRIAGFITDANAVGSDSTEETQRRACATAANGNRIPSSNPFVVFPDQELPLGNIGFHVEWTGQRTFSIPVLCGCIDYKFYRASMSQQTGFAYQIVDLHENFRQVAPDATVGTVQLITFNNPLRPYEYFFAN